MTTRSAMKTEIIDDMERDASADGARVLSAISSAIKFYQPKRFFFNESRSVTFPTVNGTDTYSFGTGLAITTEFYKIDGAFVLEGVQQHQMAPIDYLSLELLIDNSGPATGRPTRYAYVNRALRLYRVPDAAYTVRLDGHVKAAEPATDNETDNVWFTEAYELIRCRSKAYLYTHVFPKPEMAALMRIAEKDALEALRGATQDKIGTGQIIPTQF
jgi:hypothetical protein